MHYYFYVYFKIKLIKLTIMFAIYGDEGTKGRVYGNKRYIFDSLHQSTDCVFAMWANVAHFIVSYLAYDS